jgi:hypothetical protein
VRKVAISVPGLRVREYQKQVFLFIGATTNAMTIQKGAALQFLISL